MHHLSKTFGTSSCCFIWNDLIWPGWAKTCWRHKKPLGRHLILILQLLKLPIPGHKTTSSEWKVLTFQTSQCHIPEHHNMNAIIKQTGGNSMLIHPTPSNKVSVQYTPITWHYSNIILQSVYTINTMFART